MERCQRQDSLVNKIYWRTVRTKWTLFISALLHLHLHLHPRRKRSATARKPGLATATIPYKETANILCAYSSGCSKRGGPFEIAAAAAAVVNAAKKPEACRSKGSSCSMQDHEADRRSRRRHRVGSLRSHAAWRRLEGGLLMSADSVHASGRQVSRSH
jgi:hypothetical protein